MQLIRDIGFVIAVYAAFGLVLGTIAYIAGGWVQTQFVSAATGQSPDEFGPVFVAVSFLQIGVLVLFFGPIVAVFVSRILGAAFDGVRSAFFTGSVGGFFGFLTMAGIALGLLVFSKGPGAEQAFTLRQTVRPVLFAAPVTAIVGGVTAAIESVLR